MCRSECYVASNKNGPCAQTKVRLVGEAYVKEEGLCARQRDPGAEKPVCQAGRPVCRDEGQAEERCLFSQNKITVSTSAGLQRQLLY